MSKPTSPSNPQPLSATGLLSCLAPESFGGGEWMRGYMDGNPGSEFWMRREGHTFVKLEANAKYLPITPAWIATMAQGIGDRLHVSPMVYRGYPSVTSPTLPGQAVFLKLVIKAERIKGLDVRDPVCADVVYRQALALRPTCLVDAGDSLTAIFVLDEPVAPEWLAIAARALWQATPGAVPFEVQQYTDSRVSDPLVNLTAAVKAEMLVPFPGQPHPTLCPRFEVTAERVGGLISWEHFRTQYECDSLADKLLARKAEGRRMLAKAMSARG